MTKSEEVLAIVKIRGPVLPAEIAKAVGTDILFASAHLSELVDNKKLRLSYTKIGGSPVYYAPEQKAQLPTKLYSSLNDKDQRAFDLLKEKKLLEDSKLEPLNRVAMRNLKDFATPINITHQGEKILYWKWYLIEDTELQETIKQKLTPPEVKSKQPENIVEQQLIIPKEPDIHKEPEVRQPLPKLEPKPQEITQPIQQQPETKKIKKILQNDTLQEDIQKYFETKKIKIKEETVIRKGNEIDYILNIPSPIGELEYYCKAKNKKRISNTDISAAYVQGQLKKLPTIILITGELNKKAEELINSEFKGVNIIKWEQT